MTTPAPSAPLAYDEQGHGDPLLLVHAFPLDARMWQPQRDALAARFRVITPDLRGFGRSAALPPAPSIDAHADDLAALLDHLALPCAAVLGLSMGGYIALAFARRHPSRLSRLALADTRAGADSAEARASREQNIALVQQSGVGALVEALLPRLLSACASEELREQVRAIASAQSPDGVTAALAAMRDRPDATAALATLTVPTLVLVGREDGVTSPAETRGMAAQIPSARYAELPSAGHLANLEAPEAFTRTLEEFLAR
jgi:3-oxoadipate enol-lactonase